MSNALETLMGILQARRSVRRFRPEPLPTALLEQLVRAAACAPSAGNRQQWRLRAVTSYPLLTSMAAAVRTATARLVAAARPERAAELARYVEPFALFEHAPCVFVAEHRPGFDLLGATAPQGLDPDASRARAMLDSTSSVAAAVMQLLLAAHAAGLGACWMTGPLVAARELGELVGLPEGWELAALVPVGWPAESPPPPARRPLARLWSVVAEPEDAVETTS
jgi:nitroreductase